MNDLTRVADAIINTMASLEPEAVIESVGHGVDASETSNSLEISKAETTTETKSNDEIAVDENVVPAVSAEDVIPDARLLETSIFLGKYFANTPPVDGEDNARPFE